MTAPRPLRLLMLTHRFPYPPNRGDRIRSYNLLRFLAGHYRVSLGCTTDEPVSDQQLEHLNEICEQVYAAPLGGAGRKVRAAAAFARGKSLTEGMFSSPAMQAEVLRWQHSEPFDAAVVFCSSMYRRLTTPVSSRHSKQSR